jgi:tetratricopeptide (TPR) repeat protein
MRNLWMIVFILFTSISFAAQPVLKQKRTCEECRRLADKGAYEESIKAYKEFIDTHKDSFQIDDAYFAIADLYDTRLFDYPNALEWYAKLKQDYSNSTLVSLANSRVSYINLYSDYNFKPLAGFERIRSFEYAQKKEIPVERDKILAQVVSLISEYPDSNLAPVMQHWLANQYRLFSPQKAVEAHMTLRKNYPNHSETKETMLEIGETYYDAAMYKEAVAAFKQALTEEPQLAKTINSQILRANRNIRRDDYALFSIIICAIIFIIAFLKPVKITLNMIIRCAAIFILAAILLFAGAWLVRSEFPSMNQLALFAIFLAASIGLGSFISLCISQKFIKSRVSGAIVGTFGGMIFMLAAMYLTVYYVYVHYLIIFKI